MHFIFLNHTSSFCVKLVDFAIDTTRHYNAIYSPLLSLAKAYKALKARNRWFPEEALLC